MDVEVLLTAHQAGTDRLIGSYTLVHGGLLHRWSNWGAPTQIDP